MRFNKTRLRHGVGDAGARSPWRSASPPAAAAATAAQQLDHAEAEAAAAARSSPTPTTRKVSLTIGSKNFPEQEILGEIYAQALAAAGYKVKSDLSLGSETVAHKAVKSGAISGYPEYASTALTSFFGLEPEEVPADATEAWEKANEEFEKEGLVAFEPTPFASANAVGTAEDDGRKVRPRKRLRPRRRLRKTVPLRLARVPPADRLPGRAGKTVRAEVQVVPPGRHQPPLHGARKGPGGSLDPLHHRPAALGGEGQVRDPRRRQARLPGRQHHLRDHAEGRRRRPGPDYEKTIVQVQKGLTLPVMQELDARVELEKQTPKAAAAAYLEVGRLHRLGSRGGPARGARRTNSGECPANPSRRDLRGARARR